MECLHFVSDKQMILTTRKLRTLISPLENKRNRLFAFFESGSICVSYGYDLEQKKYIDLINFFRGRFCFPFFFVNIISAFIQKAQNVTFWKAKLIYKN